MANSSNAHRKRFSLRRITAGIVVLWAFGLASPVRVHAQCILFEIGEQFAISSEVSIGTVVETKPTGIIGNHVTVEVATFRRERAWKGGVGRQILVGSDVPLEVGKKYLAFAFGDEEPLIASCGLIQSR